MAIQILREPQKTFTVQCPTCDCKFSYALSDTTKRYGIEGTEHVCCPGCGVQIRHHGRGCWR